MSNATEFEERYPEPTRVHDIMANGTEDETREALGRLLQSVGDGTGKITIYTAQLYVMKLEKFSVDRLHESSVGLENLTKWLLGLTIVLAVLTAIDIAEKLFR